MLLLMMIIKEGKHSAALDVLGEIISHTWINMELCECIGDRTEDWWKAKGLNVVCVFFSFLTKY